MTLVTTDEIQERLRKRYLDRLAQRVKRMRQELVDRNWTELKSQCRQLRSSGETFGFNDLTALAIRAEEMIPDGTLSRARDLPDARESVENLINTIDSILTAHAVLRN